jgi:hypothetical protein
MGVSGADFNALVEDLVGALDKFKVKEAEQGRFTGRTGTDEAGDRGEVTRSAKCIYLN